MAKDLRLKDLILAYREEGLSYKDIADKTGVANAYARNICSRDRRKKARLDNECSAPGICRFCGATLTCTAGARKKEFCNDKCRSDFHNQQKLHRPYVRVCEFCRQEFVSYGYPKKRFCSRDCQTLATRGGKSA